MTDCGQSLRKSIGKSRQETSAVCRVSTVSVIKIPISIAPVKAGTYPNPAATDVTAGPGQIPDSPQPSPISTAPSTNLRSTCFRGGRLNAFSNKGAPRLRTNGRKSKYVPVAPPKTNIRDGSHAPRKFKNPITFAGCVIPAIASPTANISPQKRYHSRQRADRQPPQSTDTVSARTAVSYNRADTNQQSRRNCNPQRTLNINGKTFRHKNHHQCPAEQKP
ncbi:hypothetical protein CHS0354_002070 [Potamilus streckersoni]|uniref:Uncharacterized protein n=1 Tax=Potamilus streckersoni TaxID=2493646 RepID=A0AAE0W8F6_9BIVA|nr:hypothetical protein CHS0354_002070 [Potamilus streckersoni]